MNKIRVIDLLNKIANGEEMPKEILGKDSLGEKEKYIYNDFWYIHTYENPDGEEDYYYMNRDLNNLNDEIEIIEEKEKTKPITKEIEALGYACGEIQKCFTNGWKKSLKNESLIEEDKKIEKLSWYSSDELQESMIKKINEIIDYLEENK